MTKNHGHGESYRYRFPDFPIEGYGAQLHDVELFPFQGSLVSGSDNKRQIAIHDSVHIVSVRFWESAYVEDGDVAHRTFVQNETTNEWTDSTSFEYDTLHHSDAILAQCAGARQWQFRRFSPTHGEVRVPDSLRTVRGGGPLDNRAAYFTQKQNAPGGELTFDVYFVEDLTYWDSEAKAGNAAGEPKGEYLGANGMASYGARWAFMDDSASWGYRVLVHEWGHTLGFRHSDEPGHTFSGGCDGSSTINVMCSFGGQRAFALTQAQCESMYEPGASADPSEVIDAGLYFDWHHRQYWDDP
jgi:hypothetical protein